MNYKEGNETGKRPVIPPVCPVRGDRAVSPQEVDGLTACRISIYIQGGGQTIAFWFNYQPNAAWQHFSAPLNDASGWMLGVPYDTKNAPLATAAQIQAVLANVTDIRIRQEYVWGADWTGIDNVVLASPTVTNGDINNDGSVTLADAILALQLTSAITPSAIIYNEANVNGDRKIGLQEVIYILQKVAGTR